MLAVGLSVYALYWVVAIVQPQVYRVSFLLLALVLSFLLFPAVKGSRRRRHACVFDWTADRVHHRRAGLAARRFRPVRLPRGGTHCDRPDLRKSDHPGRARSDAPYGRLDSARVGDAASSSTPTTALCLILLALDLFAHRGYPLDRLVGSLYMTLEGIFGVPLDVAATYIVLFTIYGAVLQFSGAGRFFLDWAMALSGRSGSGAGPGRTVTIAGFLLGTVSGSGVATTVMLGSVAWPMLRNAGYPAEVGGAILSAAGIGAILSPPTLGAAAFLIAEFLQISYLQVLVMAIVPTLLYYLSIFLMIEADSRRLGTKQVAVEPAFRSAQLTWKYGYHFSSLVAIAGFMVLGMTAFKAVFWATAPGGRVELRPARNGAVARKARSGARSRRQRRAVGRGNHGDGRHHRGRRDVDRPRTEDRRHHRDAGGRLAAADRRVLGRGGLAARSCCSRDGVVHHRGRDDRAGARFRWASRRPPRTCSFFTTRCSRRSARPRRSPRSRLRRSPAATRFAR